MVVFTFFGAAAAYRANAHIAVAMVTDRLPASLKRPMASVVDVLMVVIAVFMVIYGFKLCSETWGQNIGEIPWMPVGATYLPVPLGGLITLIFILEQQILHPFLPAQHQILFKQKYLIPAQLIIGELMPLMLKEQ